MLHMGYLSPSVIALVYNFTSLYKKIWFHPGGDMIAFVFKSTRLVVIVFLQETWMRPLNCSQKPLQWILCLPYSMQKEQGEFCNYTSTTKCGGGGYTGFALSRRSVGRSVSNSCLLYNSFTNERISFKLEWHIHLNWGMCRAHVAHVSGKGQGHS